MIRQDVEGKFDQGIDGHDPDQEHEDFPSQACGPWSDVPAPVLNPLIASQSQGQGADEQNRTGVNEDLMVEA